MSPRQRLADLVVRRRKELQLSASRAARDARVSRGTWIALEGATRETESYNFAGIERVLMWQTGSIEAILAGGDPTPQAQPAPAPPEVVDESADYEDPDTGEVYTDADERALWDLDAFAPAERREMIYFVRAQRARKQAEQRAAG